MNDTRRTARQLDTLDIMLTDAVQRGLLQRNAEDACLDGRHLALDGKTLLNFGSCSYLGLEIEESLKVGVIDAVNRYGTQFSSSRAYMSAPGYDTLEGLLGEVFGTPHVIATPSTSLGHIAALPTLIEEDDALMVDQLVHHSVQVGVKLAQANGAHVEVLRHNRMDELQRRLEVLHTRHRRIWYAGDGVYSMFGDLAPVEELGRLLGTYRSLHLYLDDAHGMSWHGRHGRGVVLDALGAHERLVVAVSLNKAFAASGGALVFGDGEMRRKVRTCGGPMIFSGPIQPPMLGAAIASARLHLAPAFEQRQRALQDRIAWANGALVAAGLPVVSPSNAPICFIGLGLPRAAYAMANRLIADGFWVNVAIFPAVPMRRAGIRFTLTNHQTREDIEALVAAIARHLPEVLAETQTDRRQLARLFDLGQPGPEAATARRQALPRAAATPSFAGDARLELTTSVAPPARLLTLAHVESVRELDRAEWDRLLGDRGAFDSRGLELLEATFGANERPENHWRFHYYVVRDAAGKPVLATFFTEALWKDDMLAREAVSREVEERRAADPYYLTSRVLGMGSLLTEGNHLYLDRDADWRGALDLLLEAVGQEREHCGAAMVALRDLPEADDAMDTFLLDRGLIKAARLSSAILDVDAPDEAAYWSGLTASARRHQRKKVLPWNDAFAVEIVRHDGRQLAAAELARLGELYRNVKARSLELNVFELPEALFEQTQRRPGWELLLLRARDSEDGLPVAFAAAHVGTTHYAPLVVGLDYRAVETHGAYRQLLRHIRLRARQLGVRQVYLGLTAAFEKSRLGARIVPHCVYVQATDHYHQEVLSHLRGAR